MAAPEQIERRVEAAEERGEYGSGSNYHGPSIGNRVSPRNPRTCEFGRRR
jgi:hypothetical protein